MRRPRDFLPVPSPFSFPDQLISAQHTRILLTYYLLSKMRVYLMSEGIKTKKPKNKGKPPKPWPRFRRERPVRGWGGAKRVHLLNYYKAKSKKPHDFDAQRSLQISTSNVYVRRYVFRRPTRTLLAKWGHAIVRAARETPEQRKQYSRKPGAGGEGARARARRAPYARI